MENDLAMEDKNLTIVTKTETSFDFAGKTVEIAEIEVELYAGSSNKKDIYYETVTGKVLVDGKSVEYYAELDAGELDSLPGTYFAGKECEVLPFFQEIFGENCWCEAWNSFKDVINICLISEDEAVEKLIKAIQEEGLIEVHSGVYVQTNDSIVADQEGWDDGDPAKSLDFSCDENEFWVTTNNGHGPDCVGADELKRMLRDERGILI